MSVPIKSSAATLNSQAGVVSVTSGRLNVRSSASTSGTVVASLSKDSLVTLISKSGDWWRVEYADNVYGYCHANYIKTTTGSPATVKALIR